MNISVYLPNNLKDHLEAYIKNKGITKNAAVRKAIELLLNQDKTASWGTWMDNFEGDPTLKDLDAYRSELKEPEQDIF